VSRHVSPRGGFCFALWNRRSPRFRPANDIMQRAAHVCDNVVISNRGLGGDAILVFAPDGTESTFATDLSDPPGE
jgi:hypothetical protein